MQKAARKENYDESQMMDLFGVNPSTPYHTLKSRLNERIAISFQECKNPISALKDKVAMVLAMLFSNDRSVATVLKILKSNEYMDLSNELIVVYKVIARLSMYNGDFDYCWTNTSPCRLFTCGSESGKIFSMTS